MILLGLGQQAIRRIPADGHFAMEVDRLAEAIADDRAAGVRPDGRRRHDRHHVVHRRSILWPRSPTCARGEDIWLHVDAAYAGVMAIVPDWRDMFEGTGLADSLVVNPHKWLFTPFDLSVLFCRRMNVVRQAFSLLPEYLRTPDPGSVRNLMDTGIQLGRRFRALKLWMILRYFGAEGIRARLVEHVRLARMFADWVDGTPGWERVAPVPFAVVCFRHHPPGVDDEAALER